LRNRARDARKAFLWLLLALGLPAAAAETTAPQYSSVAPTPDGIGKVYMGREISHVMGFHGAQWLERTERMDEERPDLVLNALDLKPGMTVADIGAGTGYYTWRIAQRIGAAGTIYAVDVQPEMIKALERQMSRRGAANVKAVTGTPTDPKLPRNSLDLARHADALGVAPLRRHRRPRVQAMRDRRTSGPASCSPERWSGRRLPRPRR